MDVLTRAELVFTSGVSGGLRDDLVIGQVVVSQSLLTSGEDDFWPEQIIQTPTRWLDTLTAALDECKISHALGPTITLRRPLMTAADKQQAYQQSGAISVDMESAAIALEAQRRALPFIALRTILDTSREDVVGARLLDQNGVVRPLGAIRTIIANPRLIIGAIHLMRNLRRATHSLASVLEVTLPRLELT
jgi:nucleoside phosphorylase